MVVEFEVQPKLENRVSINKKILTEILTLKKSIQMLDPHELLENVMQYVKRQEKQSLFVIRKDKLWNHIIKIDPHADKRNMQEVIRELDARGWLLINSDTELEFEPACFNSL